MGTAASAAGADAHAAYSRGLAARRAEVAQGQRRERLTAHARLAAFAAGVVVAWLGLGPHPLAPGWIAVPVGVFLALVVLHDRQIRSRERAERGAAFFEAGLARLEDRWMGRGQAGESFRDASHPYAEDLDLFGTGSLFELLCTARTRGGEETLARWLLAPAAPAVARARQPAVGELGPQVALREDLARLGDELRVGLDPASLRAWGEAPPVLRSRAARWAAALLPCASASAGAAWLWLGAPPLFLFAALAVQGAFAWKWRARAVQVLRAVEAPARELGVLAALLERLERESFASPHLVELRVALETGGAPPSARVTALRRRIDLIDARRNQFFAPLAALLLWGTQLAFAVEDWRGRCGTALGRWIDAVGEIEALASLGAFAFEHPDHTLPEVADGPPRLEAEALGHPLLPAATCVRNDLRLGPEPAALVVSGSNMSGKSTLLRATGVNAVLAQAGAPVRARRLRLSRLAIGASILQRDSLLGGSSRFYAEITRLRQVVELAEGPLPCLFLLDEILHGTNSHDRGIGAEAVLRGLLDRGAIGLVTTHDLALARVADGLAPRTANVHFQDHLEDGRIAFDFRMRPGVVQRSNALALMRAVGLEV